MPARVPYFPPGSKLPGTKYEVVKQLGAGGMGVVFQVVKQPQIQGVLKLMSSDLAVHGEFRSRFFDEVRVLAQLDHPNIVRVFDYDSLTDGTPFYVMEVLQGQTLRDVMSIMGTLPPRVAFEIARQLCEALHCAHTNVVPVVHRDIKPENIFLHSPKHGEPLVKLIDFGVVAVADRKHDGSFVGTWRYAAPEQIEGMAPTAATDLYAVGLVLYEMLCGRGPFDQYETGPLVSKAHLAEIPAPVSEFAPWVPPSIVALIQSALQKDPRLRPKDAYAFAERLFELEWAASGKADKTREGPSSVGPLRKVLTEVSSAGPASGALKAHRGPTVAGVGEVTLPPDEDTLLDGLAARDQENRDRPISKREMPRPMTPPAPMVQIAPAKLPVAAQIEADTFASQESDARRRKPKGGSKVGVLVAVVAVILLLAVGGTLAWKRTLAPTTASIPTSFTTATTSAPTATVAPPTSTAPSAPPSVEPVASTPPAVVSAPPSVAPSTKPRPTAPSKPRPTSTPAPSATIRDDMQRGI